jgi:hypothetical protein
VATKRPQWKPTEQLLDMNWTLPLALNWSRRISGAITDAGASSKRSRSSAEILDQLFQREMDGWQGIALAIDMPASPYIV